ncbi:MAG: HAD family hydrolase [Magnetospirillum sp. WYHS-4]
MLTMDIDLIIFDCDGVLVDSEPIASRLLARELTALGYPMKPEDCRARFTGISMRRVMAMIEADRGRPLPADFEAEMRRKDFEAFAAELTPCPGVAEAVPALAFAKCVASSGAPEKIRHSLTLTGLIAHFDGHLFSASQVARGKPAPDLFLHAARTMGAAPDRCVVVEDARAGIEAGLAAGMRVLGFAGGGHCGPGYGDMLRAAGASAVFADMRDLAGLL